MGVLLWPAALLVFAFWSLAAWVIYGLSDWVAGLLAGAFGGVLSAELGPWAAWIMTSLGAILQFGVIAVWAIVGLAILAAPILLRRRRAVAGPYRPRYEDAAQRPYEDQRRYPDHRPHEDHLWTDREWKGKDRWRHRLDAGRDDLSALRHMADDLIRSYKKKKRKKWDD